MSFTLLSSFCFSTTMADTAPSPSDCRSRGLFYCPAPVINVLKSQCWFYLHALRIGQDLLLLLQVSGNDHGHVDGVFLKPILEGRSHLPL